MPFKSVTMSNDPQTFALGLPSTWISALRISDPWILIHLLVNENVVEILRIYARNIDAELNRFWMRLELDQNWNWIITLEIESCECEQLSDDSTYALLLHYTLL